MKSNPSDIALYLAQSVVDQPALAKVSKQGSNLLIRVAPGEEGRLIGRNGRVIQAIRTLVRFAAEPGEHLSINVDAPDKGKS